MWRPTALGGLARRMSTAKAKAPRVSAKAVEGSNPLQMALRRIEQTYGKGAVMKLGEHTVALGEDRIIPTGSFAVNDALGIGGLPKGRIVEIYGPEASGKTSLALSVIAEAQKMGKGDVAFVDVEHALDPEYAKVMGVNIDNLYVAQPDSGEQALEIVDQLVRSGAMSVVVLDSVAALVPQTEIDNEMGTPQMGMQARLMGQALRKITPGLSKADTVLIFVNQLRSKLGVMYGSNEITPGGNALKYFASMRLDVRRVDYVKENDANVGTVHRVKVVKNKMAPPFAMGHFTMMFGQGIDRGLEVLDLGVLRNVIQKKASYYVFAPDGESEPISLGQGKAKAASALATNAELCEKVKRAISAKRGPEVMGDENDADVEGALAAPGAADGEGVAPSAPSAPSVVAATVIPPDSNLLDIAIQRGVVQKKKSAYHFVDVASPQGSVLLGNSKAKAEDMLAENEDLRARLTAALTGPATQQSAVV